VTIGPGTRLGPYEVTALLGEGGMGKVWRARHGALHRDDALKVLPEIFAADPDRLARFEREAQVLASFNHPNIAHVYGLEQSDGVRAIVMELVEGPTLADRLDRGPIAVADVIPIARQIAEALEAAHDKGVVHRDLKPANVKVRADGTVKVLDFGLAKALDPIDQRPLLSQSPTITSPAMTGQGVILGTAAYMSPEQASGGHVDQRSDIWAFGCVLYEMLTGKPVFTGDSVARVLAKVLEREPDLAALPASTPARIRRLIRRCLEKDARKRLHHIADARLDIEDAASDELTSAAVTSSAPPARRASVATWAIAALVVGAAGATAAWALLAPRWRVDEPVVRSIVATLPPAGAPNAAFGGLAIAPDGRQLVYGLGGMLHLRSLRDIGSQPVRGSEGAVWPVFSPDGGSVAFFVPAESVIKRVALSGGRPSIVTPIEGQPRGLAWGADGTIVFATATSGGLWRVKASGGKPEQLTTVDGKDALAHQAPSILPNGRAVLFSAFRGASSRVGVVSLDTRQVTYPIDVGSFPRFVAGHIVYLEGDLFRAVGFDPQRLALTGSAPMTLADEVRARGSSSGFTFDVAAAGSLVYLPAEPQRQSTMVWVDRDGREDPLALPPRLYGMPRVSPDGGRIASDIRGGERNSQISVSDVKRPGWTRVASPQQGTGHWFPKWTPDGNRLVFAIYYDAPRAPGLVWVAADGSGSVQPLLTVEDSLFIDGRFWTPDGRSLLFTYGNPALPRIGLLTMAAAGRATPEWKPLVDRTEGALAGPLSPDGRWLVTESIDASGVPSLYIERFPELRDRQRVSTEGGGRFSVWSPDGRDLYYVRLSDMAMMAVSIQTTPVLSIGTPRLVFGNRGYAVGADSRSWDIAPDGRFLMLKQEASQAIGESRPIVLVQNWSDELTSVAAK
jgi:Tol biopolymer transport system component